MVLVDSTPYATSSGSAKASGGAPTPRRARWGQAWWPKAGPMGQLRPSSSSTAAAWQHF